MGETADSLFFLTAGSVSVQLPLQNGNHKRIVSFDAGSVFGEVAFVDGSTRSAMVFADTPARCFEMERDDFDRLGETHPALKIKLLQNLLIVFSSNLRKANREIATLGQ
jgi:CRP-like cAMP-binding protein